MGDITQIDGRTIAPVDVITAGSPCQDLSVAGKRAGLDGERSGLFMESVRIVKEMRQATNGLYPAFFVWENVPGAFSSNKGEDFRCVLEELCKIKAPGTIIPRPDKGKWRNAGRIMGDEWSLAWRVMDAQFWGVPQRRRRIALVMDFRGQSAPEILFEPEGEGRYFAPSRETREGTTAAVKTGVGSAIGFDGYNQCATAHTPSVVCMATGQANAEITEDISPTLSCAHEQPIAVHPDVTGTLCSSGAGLNRPAGMASEIDLCVASQYRVRRLTPLECERLQGFPDNYTNIPDYTDDKGKSKKVSDSARYKALGNSIALPPWRYVLGNISEHLEAGATLGSLFDGIGGFPLIWEELHGKGSALWASEIEPFPIAVTKYHFGED